MAKWWNQCFFQSIRQHYNVNLKGIEVGGSLLELPTDMFETGDKKGTIVDSGTTLTYLPEAAYKAVWEKVLRFYRKPLLAFLNSE